MDHFILGAVAMAFVLLGLFFLRFWRQSRDTLFLLFAIAFFVEAANRTALALVARQHEWRVAFYGLRLLAYLLIIAGVVSKNLPQRKPRS